MKRMNREQTAKFLNCCLSNVDMYRKKGLPWNDILMCTTDEACIRWIENGMQSGEDTEWARPTGTYHGYDDGTFKWSDDDGNVTMEGRWEVDPQALSEWEEKGVE